LQILLVAKLYILGYICMDEGIIYLIVCSWSTEKQSQQSGFGRSAPLAVLVGICTLTYINDLPF